MKTLLSFLTLVVLISGMVSAQNHPAGYTRQDTLRGSITTERAWWDLNYYHLKISVNPEDSSLHGQNLIGYTVLTDNQKMQIDLQKPMLITKIEQDGQSLDFVRDGNAWFINLISRQAPGTYKELTVFYEGKPKVNLRPPWDGGIAWKYDSNGYHFVANANQGDGASLWWPCKDHMYDEPDSMLMSIRVPDPLINVSNGRLRTIDRHADHSSTYHWFVSNPINNYGVNINIGDYVHFSDTFQGEKGDLDCDYWVLKDNLVKARKHFKQAHKMLEAFEYWFGPYPFYEDSYKLVEVPYPGMEHQSSVTYGNGYKNGYGGRDVSSTGYGMLFDFILVHESGHEWFANNVTYKDIADMWVHESFIAYSESLYVDYFFGKKAGAAYCRGTRLNIANDRPIIGHYDVNHSGSGDMYSKGANMLHTLRQIVDNDEKWRSVLRGLNKDFYHQTVTGKQVEDYISAELGLDLKLFFDQYLRNTTIPTFEYGLVDGDMRYRWANCIQGFTIPVKVWINGEPRVLVPGKRWTSLDLEESIEKVEVDKDYYVATMKITDS
ncbi:MAG: M1 family metallopeptidase [Bacteroidetes bacterium]|jgi:aminopeptidase N|nr:M1 family metallopeptidase [Bacteroidota bacterium]MBT4400746.1 M1 family metallopeptidase [Bacteroidota bacterium]MBT4411015.1 M1 family metallopeptidase [Bacteroidota bacterium]MBT5426303.1 M1 family metallopeptidase [Bacteroidota bacterium]MBT7463034.1 M1 family metallopeptidase [Bacteroidota bacterium]